MTTRKVSTSPLPARCTRLTSLFAVCMLLACSNQSTGFFQVEGMSAQRSFGSTTDDKPVQLFVLTNAHGLKATLTDYGARLVALEVPDRNGNLANVTLGFDSVGRYELHKAYFGC